MTTPDDAVQATLAAQAAASAPDTALDELDLSDAVPAVADLDALQAQADAAAKALADAKAAAAARDAENVAQSHAEGSLTDLVASNTPGWLRDLFATIETRLSKLEHKE